MITKEVIVEWQDGSKTKELIISDKIPTYSEGNFIGYTYNLEPSRNGSYWAFESQIMQE